VSRNSGDFSIRGATVWPGLSKLIEECGELVQVAGKLIETHGEVRHWDGSNLRDRITEEIGDVMAACYFVMRHCKIDPTVVARRCNDKLSQYEKWKEGR